MLVVYLASYKYRDLINGLTDIDIKKIMEESVDFSQFVKKDMQLYRHCTEMFIQRNICREDDEEFLELISQFQMLYDARITIYYENAVSENPDFIKSLIKMDIFNIIHAVDIHEIKKQISLCLAEGMDLDYWYKIFPELRPKEFIREPIHVIPEPHDILSADNVIFAFAGSQSRVGTTKLALGFAQYLQTNGAAVVYIEPKAKFLSALQENFECDLTDEQIARYKDIDFAAAVPDNQSYNFIIIDLGSHINKSLWSNADFKALCGCFDFTEEKQCQSAYQNLQPDIIVGNFAGETEQPAILKLYSNTKVLFSEYNPEPFFSNTNNNNKLYKDILGIYYEQCC